MPLFDNPEDEKFAASRADDLLTNKSKFDLYEKLPRYMRLLGWTMLFIWIIDVLISIVLLNITISNDLKSNEELQVFIRIGVSSIKSILVGLSYLFVLHALAKLLELKVSTSNKE